ncbi:MAG: hypothetical protein ACLFNS_05240 [Desulfobacterales bacterium]
MKVFLGIFGVISLLTAVFVQPAHAYVGPGLGAGTLAVIAGLLLSVFLAMFAVVWYPLKRILRKIRGEKAGSNSPSAAKGKEQ